ncbi:MAG TPA: glucoamylase family protein [Puia sp.]|nr:glucoamylase family protein [Puia sp.]
MKQIFLFVVSTLFLFSCKKDSNAKPIPPIANSFSLIKASVNDSSNTSLVFRNINANPIIKFSFSSSIDTTTTSSSILFFGNGAYIQGNYSYANNDSTLVVQSPSLLKGLTNYSIVISTGLKSQSDSSLKSRITLIFTTAIDSSDKFPQITDSALLTLIEQQTFNYFWSGGNSVSGLARERTSSGNTVTTGGSGFGIMGMVAAVNRGFISRSDAVTRLTAITNFLTTKCERWHGAFSHWIDGNTGATIPFGSNSGADIVETSYMMMGLLTARQYFNSNTDANELALRDSINSIYNAVEWTWFTQNGAVNGLYWQYNPSYTSTSDIWSIPVVGWDEALITYVMAASSPTHPITKNIYDNGWAQNGGMKNGNSYYGIQLPLGPSYGGPLFFAHYSFQGINPNNLTDAYANYWTQDTAHARINYLYCVNNPHNYYGYSASCWGLTASDIQNGYDASSPTEDDGVIAPTAAISSLPYTPTESMNAIRFFYYKLGDKIWGQYGFIDAFNLTNIWFDSDCLAIDQGPQIVMIENYRTGLLWNLFMSCPEVKTGMTNLGFSSPNL